MPKKIETRNLAGPAGQVFPQLQSLLLDGWIAWKQLGYCRQGYEAVDCIDVYLMREVHPEPYRDLEIEDIGRPI